MGNESLAHKELKKEAKAFLREKGFKDSEIFEEYKINGKPRGYIIDIAGISNSKKIAIELGNCDKLKIAVLTGEIGQVDIKFDEVIHRPYSEIQLKSELYDEDDETLATEKKYLVSIYNEEIYEKLKDDYEYQFQKCSGVDDPQFKLGWFGAWLIPPTATGTFGEQLQYEINFCLVHEKGTLFRIMINSETNSAVDQFLGQMGVRDNRIKFIEELKKLPDNCFIQTGYKYKTKQRRMPPLPRNWEDTIPYQCNTLTSELFEELIEYLSFYLDNGSKFEQYPVISIVDAEIRKDDLSKMLKLLKPLYKLLFNMDTVDIREARKIKEIPDYDWYVEEGNYDMLLEEAQEIDPEMDKSKLKKLVRIIKNFKL